MMPDTTNSVIHAWVRKPPRGKWQRIFSGSDEDCAWALREWQKKYPQFCDSYTGHADPNIPAKAVAK